MKKRSALIFGLLAVLLAFSMVLTGCPDPNKDDGGGGGGGNPFLGTWQATIQQSTETLTFNNDGTFTSSWGADFGGTYTANGNTAAITPNSPLASQTIATINAQGQLNYMGFVYTKVSNPGGPSGGGTFTITGYDSYQIITVTVTTQNPSSLSAWASMAQDVSHIKGMGTKAAGTSTVVWSTTPSNGTYTIIIGYQSGMTFVYKKATNVTITNGGGSASSFTTLS